MIDKLMKKSLRMTVLTFLIFEATILVSLIFTLSMIGAINLNISIPVQITIIISSLGLFYFSCKYTRSKYEDAWLHRTLEQVYEGRKLERKTILNSQVIKKEKNNISNRLHENGLTFEQYIHALEQKIESQEALLEEANETIRKNKWNKWFIPACAAMGDIIRENTVNSSHPVIIEKEKFFSRVISHYPNFDEIKNVKGEPFGSALRESWKCVPVSVKDMTGGSGRGKND